MHDQTSSILIVDDDPGIRHSFSDYLEDRDYHILTAENGAIGLALFKQAAPDLVLLDLRMPVMDGIELLRRIRIMAPDVPMIVVSGTGSMHDAVLALRLGAWDFLLKPVADLSVLEHTVEKSLERARLLKENREYQQGLERLVEERTVELRRSNERLHGINERLKDVVASASSLSTCQDEHQFGFQLLREFARHMQAAGGSIYLVEAIGLRLLHAMDPGHARDFIPFPLADESVLHHVITENQPFLTENIAHQKHLHGSGWHGYADRSMLVLPISDTRGQVAAILALHNKYNPPFTEQDREIGGILASHGSETLRAIRTFDALKTSEHRFRELAEMLPQAICETDMSGGIRYANRKAFDAFGYSDADMEAGLTAFNMIVSGERKRAASDAMKVARGEQAPATGYEYTAVRKDGSCFPALTNVAPIIQDGRPIGMRIVIADITERKRQEDLLLHQAHFDGLTGLPNRFLTIDRLVRLVSDAQRTQKQVVVIFLDLDDFKKVNDTLGHETGDQLLIDAARRLSSRVRGGDTIGRLGGDEFIILLGALTDAADARPLARDLLDSFKKPFRLDGREMVLTASIGISVYPEDGAAPAELLRKADTAMHQAKEQGRNTYRYYTSAMNRVVARRVLLEEYLYAALERGEFHVFYQPVVAFPDRKVMAFEALLRWKNDDLGNISPEEFIPIAEQTGLILPIGQYVLSQALMTLGKWQHSWSRELSMAVNLSPRQFRDPDLPQQVEAALHTSGIGCESLVLEITEGALMSAHCEVDQTLRALSNLGIGIAMDDFGTGYSSLSYLRQYPFTTLKIDRSFIADICLDPRDRELVNAAMAMARNLGLKVVAEGVETQQQLEHLASEGCNFLQGYLLGRPASADQIEAMMARREGIYAY